MRTISSYLQISIDGFFCDIHGDMSWAHRPDPEWNEYMAANAESDHALVFGRVTYEQMAGFWPTPAGRQASAAVAESMTRRQKIVFSNTLAEPTWDNTRVIAEDPVASIRRLKEKDGPNLVILGSGSIVGQLTAGGVLDAYTLVVVPIVLGRGRSAFDGVDRHLDFRLTGSRAFGNGNVVLEYVPG